MRVTRTEVAGMRRAQEWTCSDEWRIGTDGDSGETRVIRRPDRIGTERALDRCIEVRVAAPHKQVPRNLHLCLRFDALRTVRLGIDCCPVARSRGHRRRNSEIDQPLARNVLDAIRELIMEVRDADLCPSARQFLLHAGMIGARPLRPDLPHVILRNNLIAIGKRGQLIVKRVRLFKDAGLLDASPEACPQTRSPQNSRRSWLLQQIRERGARSWNYAEELIVFHSRS